MGVCLTASTPANAFRAPADRDIELTLYHDTLWGAAGDTVPDCAGVCVNSGTAFSLLDSLISYARQYIGLPYRKRGTTGRGFDCSGFVGHVFSNFGRQLPRSSRGMYIAALRGILHPERQAKKGDLVFFKGSNTRAASAGHVGIVVSEPGESLRFIHASLYEGITVTELDQSRYYKRRMLGLIRVIGE